MQLTVQDFIDRARVYVDDDHADQGGWIRDERWLSIFCVEFSEQYRRWVRMGLISPEPVDVEFTGPSVELPVGTGIDPIVYGPDVLSLVEVVEDTGSDYRLIAPLQGTDGRSPFRYPLDQPGVGWEARGTGDAMTVYLRPEDTTGSYIVRYIPQPTLPDALDDSVTVPNGADERIVLGMARRAGLKDMASSALLERLILQADAELNFLARGRVNNDAPRVRTRTRHPYPYIRAGRTRYR